MVAFCIVTINQKITTDGLPHGDSARGTVKDSVEIYRQPQKKLSVKDCAPVVARSDDLLYG